MYVVLGAAGNTGKVIAERLLQAGKQVRLGGRDENKLYPIFERYPDLAALSLGDVQDTGWLTRVFEGAEGVYVLTPPRFNAENVNAHQAEVGQSIVTAIRDAGVKNVVNLSSIGAHLTRKSGPIVGLHHQENRLNELSDVNILHLRPTYFMENFLTGIGMIKQMGVYGAPMSGERAIPLIAAQDVGEYVAQRLLALDFMGYSTRELLGSRDYSMEEATAILGKAINREGLPYVQFPSDQAFQGMVSMGVSEDMARGYVEMYEGFDTGWIRPQESRVAENTTPTTFEDFAANVFAPAFANWKM